MYFVLIKDILFNTTRYTLKVCVTFSTIQKIKAKSTKMHGCKSDKNLNWVRVWNTQKSYPSLKVMI